MELAAGPGMTLRGLESLHIADALSRHNGNRKVAAADLGIHPSTLFRKIKDLGIETPEKDGRSRKE
jgi:DNA-binding NtrC family response regulator